MNTKTTKTARNKFNFVDAYYETVNLSSKQLDEQIKKATSQEAKVVKLFESINQPMTASQVWQKLDPLQRTPITSWRRAITNLTKLNVLQKTTQTATGPYGMPEHYYKLSSNKQITI